MLTNFTSQSKIILGEHFFRKRNKVSPSLVSTYRRTKCAIKRCDFNISTTVDIFAFYLWPALMNYVALLRVAVGQPYFRHYTKVFFKNSVD